MENGQRNDNQKIRVVLPPRPDRKKASAPQQQAQKNTPPIHENAQPVRVTIPPRRDRKPSAPQPPFKNGGAAPALQPRANECTAPGSQPRTAGGRTPAPPSVRIAVPPRAGAAGAARQELSFEQLAQLASSVVMIMVHDKKGDPFASGSGIMIGRKGYIVTNNHVLSDGAFYSVRIENDDNCYQTDQIIKYNHLFDLAVIRIDRELAPLPIYSGPQKLARGQKVVAIGSPMGMFNSVSDGIIAGFRTVEDVDMIQFTAPISPGSSGGAVLNMYGEVIGISTMHLADAQNLNMAVGYEFINLFTQGFRS